MSMKRRGVFFCDLYASKWLMKSIWTWQIWHNLDRRSTQDVVSLLSLPVPSFPLPWSHVWHFPFKVYLPISLAASVWLRLKALSTTCLPGNLVFLKHILNTKHVLLALVLILVELAGRAGGGKGRAEERGIHAFTIFFSLNDRAGPWGWVWIEIQTNWVRFL